MKRHLTLIEIMIVIVLIGLISGVVAYNMRGSLDKGKIFKTEAGAAQVYNILNLAVAEGTSPEEVAANWKAIVEHSMLAKNPSQLILDGWGNEYIVLLTDGDFEIHSRTYEEKTKNDGPLR